MTGSLDEQIAALVRVVLAHPDPATAVAAARAALNDVSGMAGQPIDHVLWVPLEQVQANDYNPNAVAPNEMRLLYLSIKQDGYTQPVVTFWDENLRKYLIVDGFHRYSIMRRHEDIRAATGGRLPVVVIEKELNERIASTIRHNRARGKHSVMGMGQVVFNMLNNGAGDAEICNALGLEAEELVRLKYVTGFARLFEDAEYGRAWETRAQIARRREFKEAAHDETGAGPAGHTRPLLEEPAE